MHEEKSKCKNESECRNTMAKEKFRLQFYNKAATKSILVTPNINTAQAPGPVPAAYTVLAFAYGALS